jgi:hypothetical protein
LARSAHSSISDHDGPAALESKIGFKQDRDDGFEWHRLQSLCDN